MDHGGNVWRGDGPEGWLDFSASLRPEGPPEWVERALSRSLSRARYYPDPAMRDARRGLAAYAGVDEKTILPTAGGVAAIDLALRSGTGPLRVRRAAFGEYARRAALWGRRVLDGEDPEETGAGETLMICNPDNPTGGALSRQEVLALHRTVSGRGGDMIVDEAFIDYCPEISVRAFAGPTLSAVGSLTKILCIPGVRLGYLCASPDTVARMEAEALPWQLSSAAAAVAAELPEHLDDIRLDARINARRRGEMAEGLRRMNIEVLPSRADFLLCRFPRPMGPAAEMLRERRILVRTCASFGLPDTWLRLAVRTEEENRLLLRELEKCLGM